MLYCIATSTSSRDLTIMQSNRPPLLEGQLFCRDACNYMVCVDDFKDEHMQVETKTIHYGTVIRNVNRHN